MPSAYPQKTLNPFLPHYLSTLFPVLRHLNKTSAYDFPLIKYGVYWKYLQRYNSHLSVYVNLKLSCNFLLPTFRFENRTRSKVLRDFARNFLCWFFDLRLILPLLQKLITFAEQQHKPGFIVVETPQKVQGIFDL